ncbi:hypothetical protein KKA17_00955 [bacterium]|nr:hypothetical protein [bacterium]MBU1884742.1 hypothetical protein [bacterium]
MNIFKILLIAVLLHVNSFANTPFMLTGLKRAYPVVEIHNDYVPQKFKEIILQKLKAKMTTLGISMKDYPQRSIAFLITGVPIGEEPAVHVKLLVGEEVKRIDDGEEVFAVTYSAEKIFEVFNIDEDMNENIDDLLESFAKQYKEDNE